MTDPVRVRLAELINEGGESGRSLSRLIGRNENYLEHFMRHGTPKRLHEDDRLKLAMFFGVDERELGARDPWTPTKERR